MVMFSYISPMQKAKGGHIRVASADVLVSDQS